MKPFDIYHADFHWRTRNYPGFFLLIRQNGADWLCCVLKVRPPRRFIFRIVAVIVSAASVNVDVRLKCKTG